MKAWILNKVHNLTEEKVPLVMADIPVPVPAPNEILIRVSCCGVCHTELDEIEGRTPPPAYPMVLGHQVVGKVEIGANTGTIHKKGDRVGVAWIFAACGKCEFCRSGHENLCEGFKATGRDAFGGYAQFMVVDGNFAFPIPESITDDEAAPLLCAGAVGYRSLRLTGLKNGETIGLTGFGASGHLVLKMTRHLFPDSKVMVFARSVEEQQFALSLGAHWAGDVTATPPVLLNAIIDTTPAWKPAVTSMAHLKPGGRLVINAIRKEDSDKDALMKLIYQEHLWMEKEIKSVANITRKDVIEFLALAAAIPIKPTIERYPFEKANEALLDLKNRHVKGAKVLMT